MTLGVWGSFQVDDIKDVRCVFYVSSNFYELQLQLFNFALVTSARIAVGFEGY